MSDPVIPIMRPGETVGPFRIEVLVSTIRYLDWKASLPWWRRAVERTPARHWLLRREIRRDPEAWSLRYFGVRLEDLPTVSEK